MSSRLYTHALCASREPVHSIADWPEKLELTLVGGMPAGEQAGADVIDCGLCGVHRGHDLIHLWHEPEIDPGGERAGLLGHHCCHHPGLRPHLLGSVRLHPKTPDPLSQLRRHDHTGFEWELLLPDRASACPPSPLITDFLLWMCHCQASCGSTVSYHALIAYHRALLDSCKPEGMA